MMLTVCEGCKTTSRHALHVQLGQQGQSAAGIEQAGLLQLERELVRLGEGQAGRQGCLQVLCQRRVCAAAGVHHLRICVLCPSMESLSCCWPAT